MESAFRCEPAPDHPGWLTWELRDGGGFNPLMGAVLVRLDPDGRARCRLLTDRRHANLADNMHGGAILGFADMALFAATRMLGARGVDESAVTLDLSAQFLAAGRPGEPLDALVELLRETGRFVFLRGLMVQGEDRIAAFSATLRKASAAPAVR